MTHKVFLIRLTIVVDRETYEPYLAQHLDYLQQLKQHNVLVLSGPFGDRTGGMVLVRAASLREAEMIAHRDPLVQNGVDVCDVREWIITDGSSDLLAPLQTLTDT